MPLVCHPKSHAVRTVNEPSEKTLLSIPPVGAAAAPGGDELYRAVRDAVAESYLLLGELGSGRQGSVVYLVRDRSTSKLVALKLDRTPGTDAEYALTVAPQLDESIPSPGATCPYCNSQLVGWVQFCGRCGRDTSGVNSGVSGFTTEQLLSAVHEAARGTYEVLGEMSRARGGGVVYFAKDVATGGIVALRLQRDESSADGEFSLGRTSLLKPLVESMGADYASPTMLGGAALPATRPAASAAARSATAAGTAPPPQSAREETPRSALPVRETPQVRPSAPPRGDDQSMRTEVLTGLPFVGPEGSAGIAPLSNGFPSSPAAPLRSNDRYRDVDSVANATTEADSNSRQRRSLRVALAIFGGVVLVALAVFMATLGGSDENALDSTKPTASTGTAAVNQPPAALSPTRSSPATTPVRVTSVLLIGKLPAGSRVSIDGAVARQGANSLAPGRHTLTVRASGFERYSEVVELAPDTTRWMPKLRRVETTAAPAVTEKAALSAPTTPGASPRSSCSGASAAEDWDRARILCTEAAAAGNVTAQRLLGLMLLRGEGGGLDEAGGVSQLRLAAGADDAVAQLELGRAYLSLRQYKDEKQAYQLFRKAAAQGNREAQYQTGLAFERGTGTKRNDAEAFLWYEEAAKQGHVGALAATGVFLKNGDGVRRDESKALEIFTRAAKVGSALAYFHLGDMHEKGRAGLARSRDAARGFYQKAAALGSEEAKRALDRLK